METVKVDDLKKVLKKYHDDELNPYKILRELGVEFDLDDISYFGRVDLTQPLPLKYSAKDVVSVKNGAICFKDYEYEEEPRENFYFIELDRIDTPIKLIWWIHHLEEKGFFTRWMCKRLIEVTTEKMGFKMYEGEG